MRLLLGPLPFALGGLLLLAASRLWLLARQAAHLARLLEA